MPLFWAIFLHTKWRKKHRDTLCISVTKKDVSYVLSFNAILVLNQQTKCGGCQDIMATNQ